MKKGKAVGVIPARYLSSRFPGKPLAMILGKSLIQRTYEAAKKSDELERVIVATDDSRIFDHVKGFGGEAAMTSAECPTGTDRLNDLLSKDKSLNNYEIMLNVQGDEPCIDSKLLDKLVLLLRDDEQAVVATPVTPLLKASEAENPSVVKCVFDHQGNALYFSRALIPAGKTLKFDPNRSYFRHVGIYAYRSKFLPLYASLPPTSLQLGEDLEQLKVLENGYRIKVAIVDYRGHDVNQPEDIAAVEKYLRERGG